MTDTIDHEPAKRSTGAEAPQVQSSVEDVIKDTFEKLFDGIAAKDGPITARVRLERVIADAEVDAASGKYMFALKQWKEVKKLHSELSASLHAKSTAATSGAPAKVIRLPGGRLGDVLRVVLTRRAFDKLVLPVIADAQHEYLEAAKVGNQRLARWIGMRLYIIIWPGWVFGMFASLVRRIIGAGTGG
jgi:hypothetical protein